MTKTSLQYELPPVKQLKILLLEDDKETGNWLIKRTGLSENKNIRWTKNLSEATTEIEINKPDLIILDLNLPDGNGINILKKIKAEQLKITVFVFSVSRELKNACIRLGAKRFFDKGTDSESLVRALQNYDN